MSKRLSLKAELAMHGMRLVTLTKRRNRKRTRKPTVSAYPGQAADEPRRERK